MFSEGSFLRVIESWDCVVKLIAGREMDCKIQLKDGDQKMLNLVLKLISMKVITTGTDLTITDCHLYN